MPKLLYIHNNFINLSSKGSLNTTLLQIFSMCHAFQKAGFEVVLAMESNGPGFEKDLQQFLALSFEKPVRLKVVSWKRKTKNRFFNRFLVKPQVKKIVNEVAPDLVFTREPLFLSAILNKKVIYESHGALQHTKYRFLDIFIRNRIIKHVKHNNFICLFSISQALSDFWEMHGIDPQKLFAWHDGFDQALFSTKLSKNEARNKLNLPENKTIALYTGGLYPNREIENIIKLASTFPEVLFYVIGGPEKNRQYFKIMADQAQIENIVFTGLVPHKEIPDYLYAADILLALWSTKVPTINYCSPLKLFEYMAAGRLIITHDFPTIKEVLTPNQEAIFAKPGDFSSLTDCMNTAIQQFHSLDYGKKAREKAFKEYSWENRVDKLLDFIQSKT